MINFLRNLRKRRHCPHLRTVGIYGDEIIHCGYFRLRCLDCGQRLRGSPNDATEDAQIIKDVKAYQATATATVATGQGSAPTPSEEKTRRFARAIDQATEGFPVYVAQTGEKSYGAMLFSAHPLKDGGPVAPAGTLLKPDPDSDNCDRYIGPKGERMMVMDYLLGSEHRSCVDLMLIAAHAIESHRAPSPNCPPQTKGTP